MEVADSKFFTMSRIMNLGYPVTNSALLQGGEIKLSPPHLHSYVHSRGGENSFAPSCTPCITFSIEFTSVTPIMK